MCVVLLLFAFNHHRHYAVWAQSPLGLSSNQILLWRATWKPMLALPVVAFRKEYHECTLRKQFTYVKYFQTHSPLRETNRQTTIPIPSHQSTTTNYPRSFELYSDFRFHFFHQKPSTIWYKTTCIFEQLMSRTSQRKKLDTKKPTTPCLRGD